MLISSRSGKKACSNINISIILMDYSFKVPPETQPALTHSAAQRIALSDTTDPQNCPCCGLPSNNSQLGFCSHSVNDFNFIGPGVPLYFLFIRNAILLLTLCFLVTGVFQLATDATGDACSSGLCDSGLLTRLSIANIKNNPNFLNFVCIANCVLVILCCCFLQYVRYSARKCKVQFDRRTVSPSRYSLLVENVPQGWDQEGLMYEFDKWYSSLNLGKNLTLMVTMSFKLRQFLTLKEDKRKALIQRARLIAQGRQDQLFELDQQISQTTLLLQSVLRTFPGCGSFAIVSFESVQDRDFTLRNFEGGLKDCLGFGVIISKAPQPQQVIWINSQCSVANRTMRRLAVYLVSACLIGLTVYVTYLLQVRQSQLSPSSSSYTVISYSIGAAIAVFNIVITTVIQLIVVLEHPITESIYQTSLSSKMTLASFVNSVVSLAVQKLIVSKNNFDSQGGLVNDASTTMVMNAVIVNFLLLIDLPGIILFLKRKYATYQLSKGKCFLTQTEFNKLHESAKPDLSSRYSYVVATLWTTAVFGTIIPIAYPLSILGLSVLFLQEKYFFHYRYSRPKSMSQDLDLSMLQLADFFPLLLSFGSSFFFFYLNGYSFKAVPLINLIPSLLGLSVSFLYLLFPWSYLNKRLFKIENEQPTKSYLQNYSTFTTDYQRQNPVFQMRLKLVRKTVPKPRHSQEPTLAPLRARAAKIYE